MGFDVSYRGIGIFNWSVPRSGITFKNKELEWILAAQWAKYRYYDDWQDLDKEQKENLLAAYRIQLQIEAVLAKFRK